MSPRRCSSGRILVSLAVSSATAANGKTDPPAKPRATVPDARLINPLREISITLVLQFLKVAKHGCCWLHPVFLRSLRSFAAITFPLYASGPWIEQIKTRFRIFFLDQLNRLVRQKQFECRPDCGRNNMPPSRGPIWESNYRMSMNRRLPINQSNVSAERGHLDLVRNRNLPKRILLAIKPSQQSVLKGADRCKMTG